MDLYATHYYRANKTSRLPLTCPTPFSFLFFFTNVPDKSSRTWQVTNRSMSHARYRLLTVIHITIVQALLRNPTVRIKNIEATTQKLGKILQDGPINLHFISGMAPHVVHQQNMVRLLTSVLPYYRL